MDTFTSFLSRVFFVVAFGLAGLAVLEGMVNLGGYTILRRAYTAGRLLELAALLLIFVVAVLLRQVRDELRRRSA